MMDFKRILIVFFWVFGVVNIFLTVQLIRANTEASRANTAVSVLTEMANDNIKFTNPSTVSSMGSYLSGQVNSNYLQSQMNLIDGKKKFDSATGTLSVTYEQPQKFGTTQPTVKRSISKYLKNEAKVLSGTQYRFDKQFSSMTKPDSHGHYSLVYSQRMTGRQVVMGTAGQIRFTFDKQNRLVRYTQTYISNVEVLRDAVEVISGADALKDLYQYNELPNNSTVKWTKLAYSALIRVKADTIFVPTWVVAVVDANGDVSILRVNAIDGSVLK